MTDLVTFAAAMSPTPLTPWQKDFIQAYCVRIIQSATKENTNV